MASPQTRQLLRCAPYFPVADLEPSAAHYERVQEAYQMEEFAVRDREGYVLGFGQALARPASPETS